MSTQPCPGCVGSGMQNLVDDCPTCGGTAKTLIQHSENGAGMKLYSVYFEGHYPIGAVAVVLAADKPQAKALFEAELEKEEPHLVRENAGWLAGADWERSFVEIPQTEPKAVILLAGEY